MLDIYRFDSGVDGPTLAMFGGIHGNELAGSVALNSLIVEFESGERKLAKGKLVIVPICNPRGYEQNVRYIDVNLNRLF